MSVPKGRRNLSDMEFFHVGLKIRKELTTLLLRDFGLKRKNWDVRILEKKYRMNDIDSIEFETLMQSYGIDHLILAEFPDWYLSKVRDKIYDKCDNLLDCIVKANSIYPVIEEEKIERRLLQDRAIGECYSLLHELQFIGDILPVNYERYIPYIELINKEINYLKGWRRHTNKMKLGNIKNKNVEKLTSK